MSHRAVAMRITCYDSVTHLQKITVAARLKMNMETPYPLKPTISMAKPPMAEPSMPPKLTAALMRLIMVPWLSVCSRDRMLWVVMVVPAAAVPMIDAIMAAVGGRLRLK